MPIGVSSVVLYGSSQPDFNKLLAKGWEHLLGLHDEVIETSLVKSLGNLRFQIVRHVIRFKRDAQVFPTYTEVYVHHASDDDDSPILKGHGTPFSTDEMLAGIVWLEQELEG